MKHYVPFLFRLNPRSSRILGQAPRHATRKQFAAYLLKEFGFEQGVLVGNDKDGGFDILWFPPLGAFPFRPWSLSSARIPHTIGLKDFKSVGRAKQSLSRHSHARAEEAHLHCVLYNDYIDEKVMEDANAARTQKMGLPSFNKPSENRSGNMRAIRSSGNRTTEIRLVTLLRENQLEGWRLHPSHISGQSRSTVQRMPCCCFRRWLLLAWVPEVWAYSKNESGILEGEDYPQSQPSLPRWPYASGPGF